MRIYCDFDGTVTTVDTTDLVLSRFAAPEWHDLEEAWIKGRISAAKCMRRQIRLIEASPEQLDAALDPVGLRPGFRQFVHWCRRESVPLTLVSDGVDVFIERILTRNKIPPLPVVANSLRNHRMRWSLEQPWLSSDCRGGQGVCKCATLSAHGRQDGPRVYIGDGRSDFCVSLQADLVFARGSLADHLIALGRPFTPYSTFHEIAAVLARAKASSPSVPQVA